MYYGVTNLGIMPIVHDIAEISFETFMFDFDEDVYGVNVEVQLRHFQRPEMKFDNIEALHKQIDADAQFARQLFMI